MSEQELRDSLVMMLADHQHSTTQLITDFPVETFKTVIMLQE